VELLQEAALWRAASSRARLAVLEHLAVWAPQRGGAGDYGELFSSPGDVGGASGGEKGHAGSVLAVFQLDGSNASDREEDQFPFLTPLQNRQ